MRKVLRKVKSQWVVLGVMGATVVSLGTANIQKVSAAETESTTSIETIEQTGNVATPDDPITILEEDTITEEVVDSNLDEGGTIAPTDDIIAVGTKDVTAPVIDGSSISVVKTSVTQGESINISVNITDDSGIALASMTYLSPITGKTETIALSKNEISGLFEGAFTVTDATELGIWECSNIEASDTHGNSSSLSGSDADLSGAVFTVNKTTATADTKSVVQASPSVAVFQSTAASAEVTGLSAAVVAETEVQETPVVNLATEGTISTSVPFDNISYATNTQTGNTAEYARGTSGVQWVQADLGASYDLNEIQLWHYYGDGRSYHDVVVQLSNDASFSSGIVTVFNNDKDGSAGLGLGTDSEYSETSAGKKILFDTITARYARFYSNGSTVNSANHYVEIEVYGVEPQTVPTMNLVPESTLTSSVTFDNLPYAANTKADNTAEYARGTSGLQWVQSDLGASYDLNEIQLWHYYGDGRSYHDVVVQLSNDASFSSGVVTVFNNDKDGSTGLGVGTDSEYSETSAGKKILFDTITARYARFYSNGSTMNGANHYVEIEVYGVEPQTVPTMNLVPESTLTSSVSFDNLPYAANTKADNTAEYARGTSGLQWVQADLGASYDLNEIQLWHYYGDGRSYHDVVVQLSNDATFSSGAVTVFNNDKDGSAGLGVGTDSEYKETSAGKTIVFDTVTSRYARFYSNGSTVNGANHYIEIEVYGVEPQTVPTVNLAPEGTLSSSVPFDNSSSATDKLADDTAKYARGSNGLQWMQVDLGASYDLNEIQLWHYYGDGRSYHDVVVQLSNDASFASGAVTVFNNDRNGSAGLGVGTDSEYKETSAGKTIAFNTTNARYARFYSNGSTVNGANHYVEIGVYGTQGTMKSLTVAAAGDTSIVLNGKTLQMSATATLEDTTEASVIWSVEDGTGTATIDEYGLLTATASGRVTVKATAKGGSGIFGIKEITVAVPVMVTGYAGTGTDLVIPEIIMGTQKGEAGNYDGFNIAESLDSDEVGIVTGIGSKAFLQKELTSVIIPDSVTSIGNRAFAVNKLTSIVIPGSVTSMEEAAFTGNQLTNVVISEGVTGIGYYAFTGNQLTNLVIPDSVKWIGKGAFGGNQLTSVVISEGVTGIMEDAFVNNQLTSIMIPNSLIYIGSGAFSYNHLTSVVIPDSWTRIESRLFSNNQLTSITIPDNVTSIGGGAFSNNQLTSVVIPNNVTSIGPSAFSDNHLTSVVIPDSVTSFGPGVFSNNQLTNVVIPDSWTSIGEGAFADSHLISVVIPDSVTIIDIGAFAGNQLTSVVIPTSVTSIGFSAFENNQLTNVVIPDSVTGIPYRAFAGNQLTSITIPDSVMGIGTAAFENNQLTTLVIPDSVKWIGNIAFAGNQLTSITIGEGVQMAETILGTNNNFRTAYATGSAGTYTGTQNGEWIKVS